MKLPGGIVFLGIQNWYPENASKIMGLLLIQDHGEKEKKKRKERRVGRGLCVDERTKKKKKKNGWEERTRKRERREIRIGEEGVKEAENVGGR